MTYKVIKPFGKAIKGDVFTNAEDPEIFEMTREEDADDVYSEVYISITADAIDEFVNDGFLEELVEENPTKCCDCHKLAAVSTYIDGLLKQYDKDHEDLMKQYNEGDVPECVKVEAETVYFNMIKDLKAIKKKLDE